jgi:ABC-2 type transport system ATP-binding protein
MKQKICVIGSVLHRPKLWVLDEPLTGLDAKIANALKDYIVSFCADGNTVLFSTHTLDFVEKLCTRALIIKDGRLTDDVDLASFKESRGDFYTFAMSAIGG